MVGILASSGSASVAHTIATLREQLKHTDRRYAELRNARAMKFTPVQSCANKLSERSYSMPKLQRVKDFAEARQNAIKFSTMSNQSPSLALVRFSTFKNWYYFPEGDKSEYWGPSKFIGYHGTRLLAYSGQGHGGATTKTLQKWFDAIDPSSSKYEGLRESLEIFAEGFGKKLCSTITIHVPKYSIPINDDLADREPFEPHNDEDARNRVERSIAQRRGQAKFRNELLRAYENKCAITKCSVKTVLEAAHICPYRGDQSNNPGNGILLRSDLHTLFDAHKLAIDPKKCRCYSQSTFARMGAIPICTARKSSNLLRSPNAPQRMHLNCIYPDSTNRIPKIAYRN